MSLYHYNNFLRLSYWWSNPNEAAVMIGMLLPFVWTLAWYVEREKLPSEIVYLVWITECAALILLVYTFSRWAILAGICSALAFGWIAERKRGGGGRLGEPCLPLKGWWDVVKAMKNTWLRVSVLVIALIVTGAWGRFLIAAQGDRSVLNRFTLWTGGLRMIADRPLSGWGDGTAGVNYDNWYMDLSSQTLHGGMTNSWLNIGVEWGLPVLGIILFGLFLCLLLCFQLGRNGSGSGGLGETALPSVPAHSGLLAGAAAIIVYFALVNVGYSTIYYILPLAVLGVAVLIISRSYFMGIRQGVENLARRHEATKKKTAFLRAFASSCETMFVPLIKPLIFAFSISAVCVISLYLGGVYALRNDRIRVNRISEGNILLRKEVSSAKPTHLTIAPDYRTLGVSYGRSIRSLLYQDLDNFDIVQVLEPETDFNACIGEKVIVLGARVRDWGTRVSAAGQGIIFVCPTTPPAEQIKLRQLFLPRIDRWHVVEAWKGWAEKNGCPLTFLMGDGILDEANLKKILDYCNKL